ncbi:MAG: 50S ribosomal protein L13 [Bacillota bacterium]|jgi:large subunit ribosomal protein L13|nr:50S ribosomal protein L13 [Bacillota bacterium]HOC07009.1 50S ribosomal protein L13 [Bacillota bacterium]HPZ22795.1 50S ribosomal protein L13 [Bacillota bacterium]HQD20445.1 50S ribosomal protein L13 [Bacillota bacterium]
MQSTYMAKPAEIKRKWLLIDAEGKTLGRLASEVAALLRGKHKPTYTPHVDSGDHVVIINASKVVVSGNKAQDKLYYRYSGYPGGLRAVNFATLMEKKPTEAVYLAVKGMLPHNKLGRAMLKKLRVYAGPEHEHAAQQPEKWELRG